MSNSNTSIKNEADLQIRCVVWFERNYGENSNKAPDKQYVLYHIPNQGKRSMAFTIKLKRMGMKIGMPDLHLPVGKCGYNGLYIEMKYGKGKSKAHQKQIAEQLRYCNNLVLEINSFEEFQRVIKKYLGE